MSKEIFLDHRGALVGLYGLGDVLVFATDHPEGQPTAVYRANPSTGAVTSDALPTTARSLLVSDAFTFVGGADGRVYRGPQAGGALAPFGPALPAPAVAFAALAGDRVAVAAGPALLILGADGKELQRFELPDALTAVAADPGGLWIAAGTSRGLVQIYECEERPAFIAAESARLHEGAVTALLFEPEGLRFLSAGVDRRLLSTHARGALEAEDRGGRQGHDDAVTALLNAGERFYTGGRDGQLKVWGRDRGNRRSQTLKQGAGRAVALAEVTFMGRTHVAAAGDDAAIRVLQLDGTGKPVLLAAALRDAYAKARNAFTQREPERRQQALKTLAGYNDQAAIALLAERADADDDLRLRVEATTALGASGNPRAIERLDQLLRARSPEVRLAALTGLRALEGEAELSPLDKAIASGQANVGVAAVEALGALAAQDDEARVRLVRALDHATREVRFAALEALEGLGDAADPEASLLGLGSRHADLRWFALLRTFQRALLDKPAVQSALRRHGEDGDATVRQLAFHLAVLARPALAAVLRHRDRDLHRQLHQLETYGKDATDAPAPKKVSLDTLSAEDRRPLLEAMASRALDTCVRGAVALALIQDGRAFGTLLQLSRESDEGTRVAACRALESQGDPRALQRLRQMLRDPAEAARDAAYTAVVRLLDKAPLDAAEAGLMAQHEDVRRRGLKQLVKLLKADATSAPALALLGRALNDAAPAVRTEAFKTVVNLPVGGEAQAALRFALQSLHADLRREVLTEVMGEIAQPWAWPLLLDLMDDPDATVRREAFEFARKKGKGRDPDPVVRALASPHADLRLEAIGQLARKANAAARARLIEVLDDADAGVRLAALAALEAAGDDDALQAALGSARQDVRIRAASALAATGVAAAAEPLLAQLEEPTPEVGDLRRLWQQRVEQALAGLGALGDPRAAVAAARLTSHDDASVRAAAARALAWTCPPDDVAPLRAALQSSDAAVKVAAALGLAWLGDATGAALLGPPAPPPTGRGRRNAPAPTGAAPTDALVAALTLGDADGFLAWLDVPDEAIRRRAVQLLLMLEWREGDGTPDRCLAALSSSDPRVRLTGAEALEFFADSTAFGGAVLRLLNARADGSSPWTLPLEVAETWADALTLGDGRLRVRAASLFDALGAKEQAEFEQVWGGFQRRHGAAIAALVKKRPKAAKPVYSAADIDELVLGAYVGLSRLSGGGANARVRQTALARLAAAAASGRTEAAIMAPVFLQALRDDQGAVRAQAFEHLSSLGFAPARLAAEALATGHRDVGVLGLKLLAAQAGDAGGVEVLREVLVTRIDGLEHEASALLVERIGEVAALAAGLEARSEARRRQSLAALGASTDPAAVGALQQALGVRFEAIRDQAAMLLAQRRDAAAFEPLVAQLQRTNRRAQGPAADALLALGDPRGQAAVLQRVEQDPHGTADAARLLAVAGAFRRVEGADRLFALAERDALRSAAFGALLTLSGYDQPLRAPDDDTPDDERWLADQHPRQDAILARLLTFVHGLGDAGLARQLLRGARWAKSAEVGEALAPLGGFGDARVRQEAVAALGWRLRHRDGAAAPLVTALGHAEPLTAFIAAEELALAGRADGITLLLSAIDLGETLDQRQRAVKALGTLADARALDVLLRLVSEDGHALQEEAAAAIGHLAGGDRAERIYKQLARLVAAPETGVAMSALTGLRWFGGTDAWRLILAQIEHDDWRLRERAADLLGYADDEAARAALIKRVRADDDWDVVQAAATSLRRQFGPDSLEPDFAFMISEFDDLDDDWLRRVAEQGDAARILATLPEVPDEFVDERVEPLVAALLERRPRPIAAAAAALASPHHRAGTVAARILGQGGAEASAHGEAIAQSTAKALADWQARRARLEDARQTTDEELEALTERLRQLVWASGRLGVAAEVVMQATALGGSAADARPVRAAALTALADGLGGEAALDALSAAATGPDAAMRTIAAAALAQRAPDRATALLERALDDRQSLDRLLTGADPVAATAVLRRAAGQVHAQGVALPYLVARADVEGLKAAADDAALDEATRLGAIEGLARVATAPAQAALAAVGAAAENDEVLRKAAWRGLRRAKRAQARQTTVEVTA
ncbi:MAG: HEAT repeat domain-containing protein [Myxococcales bacterium]|nr:HEAT repeat domain-containing protein [Myxococcales bacterium]